jgi:hypothetical protein
VPTYTPTETPTPTNTPLPTFTPTHTATPDSSCGPLSQEAENALLFGSFNIFNDEDASGGQYIKPGVYAPSGSGNSFFVTIDGLPDDSDGYH